MTTAPDRPAHQLADRFVPLDQVLRPRTPAPRPGPDTPPATPTPQPTNDTQQDTPQPPAPVTGTGNPAGVHLTGTHKALVALIVIGAVAIAGIGFAGSYSAVRDLAAAKGFGAFSGWLPIGIDAGIGVLLALDLLLTWLRMPYPALRQMAWLLTGATIAFNGAAAWPDPLGVGMHATIPILFITVVEAARHAVGRIADITADRHIETPRIARWLLAPTSTFTLWRRQQVWEIRSYQTVIDLERDRLTYRMQLRERYGRKWRRNAASHELLALKLARLGVPVKDTLERLADTHVAADKSPEKRHDTSGGGRQDTAKSTAKTGSPGANSTANTAANWRQQDRQLATEGAANNTLPGARKDRQLATEGAAKKTAKTGSPGASSTAKKTAKKNPAGANTRRSMDEWVDLTTDLFHSEFRRLRTQPTGDEFADAIKRAGHGNVSASTAKNIRTQILDRTALPALD